MSKQQNIIEEHYTENQKEEDINDARFKKRTRWGCASFIIFMILIMLAANYKSLPIEQIKYALDFKTNTKEVVIYQDGTSQYVVLPYAKSYDWPFIDWTSLWLQPNGDCIVMFHESVGDSGQTRFYRYNKNWEFQNEVTLVSSFAPADNVDVSRINYIFQPTGYSNYSAVVGMSYIQWPGNNFIGTRYDLIFSYDEELQLITPMHTIHPAPYDSQQLRMQQMCSIHDTYLTVWEDPEWNNARAVLLQDAENLIWGMAEDEFENLIQSEFNIDARYNSISGFNIATDGERYYMYANIDYRINDEWIDDNVIIVLDQFGNMTPFLLSSVLPDSVTHEYYYRIHYNRLSGLLELENDTNVRLKYDAETQQLVFQDEAENIYTEVFFYADGKIYSLCELVDTPIYKIYQTEYLKNENANCDNTLVIVIKKQ